MSTLVALLRAVNVGGTGKLPMADLVRICERCGLSDVKTYIQSGNVVFRAEVGATKVKAALETALEKKLGTPARVFVRKPSELELLLSENPFEAAPPNRVLVFFYDKAVPKGALEDVETPGGEELVPMGKHLFIHFPNGQGRSRLKVPAASAGTGRNLNTVSKLVAMARTLGKS